MTQKISSLGGRCRHEQMGRCSNHFWNVMKKSGKPGLAEYTCVLWKAKLEALEDYHQDFFRARCFGLKGERRGEILRKLRARRPGRRTVCADYRPSSGPQCRYFFLEACLLKFPPCPGRCDDFLPEVDQR
ncbi:MAG: hypothetical protein AB1641_08065 [Thermodesulfobacteriota bacterium]